MSFYYDLQCDDGLLDFEPGMQILLPSEEATPEQAATQYANITVARLLLHIAYTLHLHVAHYCCNFPFVFETSLLFKI